MKVLPTFRVVFLVICALGATRAFGYDNATVWNAAHYPVDVVVSYSGCRSDAFTVPAATPQGPGSTRASANRGSCLITSVAARLNAKPFPIEAYTSSGTSHSRFVVRYMGKTNYKIFSDWELQHFFEREAQNPNSPEGVFSTPVIRNQLNAPLGSSSQTAIAECRARNVALDKEIDEIFRAADSERRIKSADATRYYRMENAIRDRRVLLAKDGFTIEDCNTLTQQYLLEKEEVIKMILPRR